MKILAFWDQLFDVGGRINELRNLRSAIKNQESVYRKLAKHSLYTHHRFKTFKRYVLTFVWLEGDDYTSDESSYSNSSRVTPGESISQTLRNPKPLPTVWRLSFSRWQILRSHQLLRLLTWRWGLISWYPASESQLTTPDEVHKAIRDLKICLAPGPICILNRALKHSPKRAGSLLAHVFNAVLRTHHIPQARKHARVISIVKPAMDPALFVSYRPISLFDKIGKLFEIILLAMI